ncbi:M56 family metallopeptidase [Bacillus sp. JJ722]|uniref:M56 family metallopeptidase n=1 Tax=Bacillus sp. JJ722 TaxID=3122973 RepID=UPI003000891B
MVDVFNVYLPRFFNWVIETSIMASILVGLILCVRFLLRSKLTPRWQYMLWLILMIRLLLPWSPESSYSIYSILSKSDIVSGTFYQETIAATSKESIQEQSDMGSTNIVTRDDTSANGSIQPEVTMNSKGMQNEETLFSFSSIVLYIWLAGIFILGIATIIMNRRLHSKIAKQPVITDERTVKIFENCKKSTSIQQDIPLILAGKISSPTVFGFFRPRVLLSSAQMKVLNEQQLRYIFYHELSHIKRRDVGVNWLMHSLLILNWFNPILWYAYICMREDQELACDALALTYLDSEEQIAYGHTIIKLLEQYSGYYQVPSLANLSRNKRILKRRILMIKTFQKKSYRWSALGVMVIVGISTFSLLNARAEETKEIKTTVNTTVKASESISRIIENMVGTPEKAKEDWGMSQVRYEKMIEEFSVAEKILTKEEFEKLVQLTKEDFSIKKNAFVHDRGRTYYNYELLSQEDNQKLFEINNAVGPLWGKIQQNFPSTIEDAQKVVDFNFKQPTYIPKGYKVINEEVSTGITIGKPKPVVRTEYVEGDASQVVIWQSEVIEGKENPWNQQAFHTFEEYKLKGNHVTFGKYNDSNITGLKVIVPARNGEGEYQIVITSSTLKKAELEKIMLSMIN